MRRHTNRQHKNKVSYPCRVGKHGKCTKAGLSLSVWAQMTWRRFQLLMVCFLCLLVTCEVYRVVTAGNVHAFIDSVLVGYMALWTWHERKVR
jgi:hypothetical protein